MESNLATVVRTVDTIGREFQRVVTGIALVIAAGLAAEAERIARDRQAAVMRRQINRIIDQWQAQRRSANY